MGGQWKHSESPDRFGQRLDLVNETAVRITGLEMEDSGLFKVSVRLPLARIWYHTFNLTVYGPPTVKVTRKTLLCQAYGFYPKKIDSTWRKEGKVKQEDTFCGVVSPNADGTYYTWFSIEVDPMVRSRYQCHVEHDGLQDPLGVTMEESVPVWIISVGVSVNVLLVLIVVAGLILYRKKPLQKTDKSTASENLLGETDKGAETEKHLRKPYKTTVSASYRRWHSLPYRSIPSECETDVNPPKP